MPSRSANFAFAFVHVAAFLGGSLVIMLVLGVVTAAMLLLGGGAASSSIEMIDLMNGLQMGLLTIGQIGLLALWATALAATLGPPGTWLTSSTEGIISRLPSTLAFRKVSGMALLVALLGGLTVWTFPSYLANFFIETLQMDSPSLEATSTFLATGPALHRIVMALAVVVSAPICEELIFRGYLWQITSRAGGEGFAWFFTTSLFAVYHLDPIHVVSLLPTAIFLGWLRYYTGSIWPPMLAHFANNSVATVVVLALGVESEAELFLFPSLIGTTFTIILCAALAFWHRPAPGDP